jgi:hypothetical protein
VKKGSVKVRRERVAKTQLGIGTLAPIFAAQDENGDLWRLTKALERSPQALIFYLGDW